MPPRARAPRVSESFDSRFPDGFPERRRAISECGVCRSSRSTPSRSSLGTFCSAATMRRQGASRPSLARRSRVAAAADPAARRGGSRATRWIPRCSCSFSGCLFPGLLTGRPCPPSRSAFRGAGGYTCPRAGSQAVIDLFGRFFSRFRRRGRRSIRGVPPRPRSVPPPARATPPLRSCPSRRENPSRYRPTRTRRNRQASRRRGWRRRSRSETPRIPRADASRGVRRGAALLVAAGLVRGERGGRDARAPRVAPRARAPPRAGTRETAPERRRERVGRRTP